ncbi:MAG: hypothetical protein PW843_14915 [Azospirillaceae bacterium]|nr:hypothetical protein [Azospirillaceae bacterium]
MRFVFPSLARWRPVVACLFPVAFLAADFVFSPILIDTYIDNEQANITEVLRHGPMPLGNFRGHRLLVSVDDLAAPDFLANVSSAGKNALLVSVFQQSSEDEPVSPYLPGVLARGILARLDAVSPRDRVNIIQRLEHLYGEAPGQAYHVPVHIPAGQRHQLPLDSVIIVTLPATDTETALASGLRKAFLIANENSITNVIVPSLTLKWKNANNKNDTKPYRYFEILFNNITTPDNIDNIYISIYKSWPSIKIEELVTSINSKWKSASASEIAGVPLHHRSLRLLAAFLIPCLFMCTLRFQLSLKNTSLLSVIFCGAAYSFMDLFEKLTDGQGGWFKTLALLLGLGTLSLLFPEFSRLDPEKILRRRT